MHSWCPERSEEGVGTLDTRVIDVCEQNPSSLEEQQLLLSAEPTVQHHIVDF